MKNKIVLIGGGGHCKVIINTIKKLNNFEILGYTDNTDKGFLLGVKYLGTDSALLDIIKENKNCSAVIGVGGVTISNKRQEIYKMLKEMEFELPVIISRDAVISEDVSIGEGTVVLEDAIINVSSQIGKCVIVNNGAIIEHGCVINDFAHLTPMTRISSGVNIGNNSFIGSGAIISRNRKVLENCFIGAGAVLVSDATKQGLYLGVPAILRTGN
ncbi:MAG TPA: serine acetyltransferase [Ignavibacteriales bacterium]|nr:serine acetyltransferase [Ignavibacteriales bacterium]